MKPNQPAGIFFTVKDYDTTFDPYIHIQIMVRHALIRRCVNDGSGRGSYINGSGWSRFDLEIIATTGRCSGLWC